MNGRWCIAVGALVMACAAAACGGGQATATGPSLVLALPSLEGSAEDPETPETPKMIDFSAYEGRFLVVHVFSTWAMPSAEDALHLQEAFGDDPEVAVVGVALDPRGAAVVAPWRRGVDVKYPIALATERVRGGASPLGSTRAVPFTLLYDRRGRRLARWDRPLGAAGIREIRKHTKR